MLQRSNANERTNADFRSRSNRGRLDEGSHDHVLDLPEVTEAVGAEIIAELRRLLDN